MFGWILWNHRPSLCTIGPCSVAARCGLTSLPNRLKHADRLPAHLCCKVDALYAEPHSGGLTGGRAECNQSKQNNTIQLRGT